MVVRHNSYNHSHGFHFSILVGRRIDPQMMSVVPISSTQSDCKRLHIHYHTRLHLSPLVKLMTSIQDLIHTPCPPALYFSLPNSRTDKNFHLLLLRRWQSVLKLELG